MVSLNVVSLFTKVPTNETLAVVWDKLAADPPLKEHTCSSDKFHICKLILCQDLRFFGF